MYLFPYHKQALSALLTILLSLYVSLSVFAQPVNADLADYYSTSQNLPYGVRYFDTRRFDLGATRKFGNQQAKTSKNAKGVLGDELRRIGS